MANWVCVCDSIASCVSLGEKNVGGWTDYSIRKILTVFVAILCPIQLVIWMQYNCAYCFLNVVFCCLSPYLRCKHATMRMRSSRMREFNINFHCVNSRCRRVHRRGETENPLICRACCSWQAGGGDQFCARFEISHHGSNNQSSLRWNQNRGNSQHISTSIVRAARARYFLLKSKLNFNHICGTNAYSP